MINETRAGVHGSKSSIMELSNSDSVGKGENSSVKISGMRFIRKLRACTSCNGPCTGECIHTAPPAKEEDIADKFLRVAAEAKRKRAEKET